MDNSQFFNVSPMFNKCEFLMSEEQYSRIGKEPRAIQSKQTKSGEEIIIDHNSNFFFKKLLHKKRTCIRRNEWAEHFLLSYYHKRETTDFRQRPPTSINISVPCAFAPTWTVNDCFCIRRLPSGLSGIPFPCWNHTFALHNTFHFWLNHTCWRALSGWITEQFSPERR